MSAGYILGLGLPCFLLSSSATGFTAPRGQHVGLQLADGSGVRPHRAVVWNRTPPRATKAHAALATAIGATDTIWDDATGVPLRIWGAGAAAPGAVASPGTAARGAAELLRRHLAVLAPGSAADDLVLVGNELGAGVRSVGFRQHYHGRPVLGGQVSFRFKADRVIAIGSEALPNVRATLTDSPVSAAVAAERATAWVLADAAGSATAGAVEGPFILPIVGERGVRSYREVLRVQVAAEQPIGRYDVYVDAATGAPVAREQTLRFASGAVRFEVPKRGPKAARAEFPAPLLDVTIGGDTTQTDAEGVLPIDGVTPLVAGVKGELVSVTNKAGAGATKDLVLNPGGAVVWKSPDDENVDAQLAAYIHAGLVKEYVRAIAPDFAYLDQKLSVRVNINDVCNAFSEGDAINFFASGGGCENTGRIADIVYHEFGHSVHSQAIIPGVGAFDGALSEGISDYLSATITDDSGLGRGFFSDSPDGPLRELDPDGHEWHWPEDLSGEPHNDGLIIAGTEWDLRALLREKLGLADGTALADKLWFESIRRATDIPSMYTEALVTDDDDGDLSNGTPNECEINKAFYAHGLLSAASGGGAITLGAQAPEGTPVTLTVDAVKKACVDLKPVTATLRWRAPGSDAVEELAMDAIDGGFVGLLPAQKNDTILEYQVQSALVDATQVPFPSNAADPWYQMYTGPVVPIYCTGFEGAEGVDGWEASPAWQQGAPTGNGGDPSAPFAGSDVLGVNLEGTYKPSTSAKLTGPVIPTGDFEKVRLQYRRWLGVEDAFFDQATIRVNGQAAWRNLDSNQGDSSNVHHTDREWRFHDIDITPGIVDGAVQIGFELKSDQGLELAGWNIDEFCVVGVDPSAASTCGDGVVDDGEDCDDGNQDADDGCSPTCESEAGPVTTGDTPTTGDEPGGEESGPGDASSDDGGSSSDGDDATGSGELDDEGCGCRSSNGPADLGALGLGAVVLMGLRRRRR